MNQKGLKLLAAMGAALIALSLSACNEVLFADGSIPQAPSASQGEAVGSAQAGSTQAEPDPSGSGAEISEPEPSGSGMEAVEPRPEPVFSDWEQGEWSTSIYNESETCRFVDSREVQPDAWSEWSEWTTDPIEASDTVEVRTKEEETYDWYWGESELYDAEGSRIPGEYKTVKFYYLDEEGKAITILETFYSSRTRQQSEGYTEYLYEFRDFLNYEEIMAYDEAHPENAGG